MRLRRRLSPCAILAVALLIAATLRAAELSEAAQPQLATNAAGIVWLAYGHGEDVFIARSTDGGGTFAPASKVAHVPKLMLGMRRGPRLVAHGEALTITVIAPELLAFSSSDGGKNWSGPATVNDTPASAREGLHDLAVAPDGELFTTWLDLRHSLTELWGATSRDGGHTWSPNEQIYCSPDKSICECCHPSALFDAEGNLAVMWRNSIAGCRDLWMATRPRGAAEFSPAHKLGSGTWPLAACPMDGGRLVALGRGKFGAVWQRAGAVYYAPPEGAEILLGKGKQPAATIVRGELLVVWQDGAGLVRTLVLAGTGPIAHAAQGRFAVLAPAPDGRGALLAYEQGPAKSPHVVIEKF